ncbi:MAG: hypothetical protein M1608_07870 [Candidatus Omnitrophica bacterium]|nr:hypothetical protein [Candidatus Omnitrophota bacterium]
MIVYWEKGEWRGFLIRCNGHWSAPDYFEWKDLRTGILSERAGGGNELRIHLAQPGRT